LNSTDEVEKVNKKDKKKELSRLVGTFFRNGIRSNLDLTSMADNKASILISLNGFILTVAVTASSFAIHTPNMAYAFIAIILTSLGSIIFAVLAVKPRTKEQLISKRELQDYSSVLYYQDMADLSPLEYNEKTKKILKKNSKTKDELISHLHIIGSEIKKKYFWLKIAYTYFSVGLTISAIIIIYALTYIEKSPFYNLKKGNIEYKTAKFYNIFEPSGVTVLNDSKILIAEDGTASKSLKLLEFSDDKITELGDLYIPKDLKKRLKKIEGIEAITSKNSYVFAITSHSSSERHREGKSNEKLIMFKYDDGSIKNLYEYSTLKSDLHKAFADIFENILNIDDIDIEGLTINDEDELLIAFRSPLVNAKAVIVRVKNPFALFLKNEKIVFDEPIFLNLKGLGIRDIVYDKNSDAYWIWKYTNCGCSD